MRVRVPLWIPAFGVSFAVASGGSALLQWHSLAGHAVDPASLYSADGYSRATRRISGILSTAAERTLGAHAQRARTVAVVLRAEDLERCEDLGRQLRMLRRSIGDRPQIQVMGETRKTQLITDFFARERIPGVRVVPLDAADVIAGTPSLPTPAVLVIDSTGTIVDGVAHPVRFPNSRFRSFAEEMAGSLRAVAAMDAVNPHKGGKNARD